MVVEKRKFKIKWTDRITNDEAFPSERRKITFKNLKK
jgi:hypothetical protein